MDSPATPQDVADRWRPLTSEEEVKTFTLLDDAWQIIKAHVSNIEARLSATPPTLATALVIMIQAGMVIRVLRNPDGKRQEQIEDYSYVRDDSASGLLYLDESELDLLADSATPPSGAFTIRPYVDPSAQDTWVSPASPWDW
jgi:hypothetical protein